MSTFVVKTINLSLVFTENQHLAEFSPIIESFIPMFQKRGLLNILLHRSFSLCCDFKTFHFKIDHLKTILMKNNHPSNFIELGIKSFYNKLYTPKVIFQNVPKRNIFVKL